MLILAAVVVSLLLAIWLAPAFRSQWVKPWVRWVWRGTGLLVLAALVVSAHADNWFPVRFWTIWTLVATSGVAGIRFPRPRGESHSKIPLPLQGVLTGLLIGAAVTTPGLLDGPYRVGIVLFAALVPLLAFSDVFTWATQHLRPERPSMPR